VLLSRVRGTPIGAQTKSDQQLRCLGQAIRQVVLHIGQVAQHFTQPIGVPARPFTLPMPAQVRQCHGVPGGSEATRKLEVASPVFTSIVDDGDGALRFAGGGEFEDVEEEETFGGVG